MWKVGCIVMLLPVVALAQSAGESPSSKSANPLEGVKFWPKAQPFRNSWAVPVAGIRVSNVPRFGQPAIGTSSFADIWNRTRVKPGTERCAIPLVRLMAPLSRNFKLHRLVPAPTDESFVTTPAVPSCGGE